jgi:HEAT repeat protein
VFDIQADVVMTDSPTNHGDSGGPLVNDRAEMIAVVQGAAGGDSNALSFFIDVSEVRGLLGRYSTSSGTKLALATGPGVTPQAGAVVGDVAALIRSLGSPDAKARAQAAQSLAAMGPAARNAITFLVPALKDKDELVRRLAAEALAKIGPPAKSDVPALAKALQDSAPEVRLYAAEALGQAGGDAQAAVGPLTEAAKDSDAALREQAVRALGKVGAAAKEAVQAALLAALKDDAAGVRAAAAEALGNLPLGADDVDTLLAVLRNRDAGVRAGAARALGKVGAQAKAAVKPLTAAAHDASAPVRQAAVEALGKIGPDAKEAAPALTKAAEEPELRKAALTALAQLGPAAHEAAPAVAGVLKGAAKEDRLLALDALAALKPSTAAEVKEVVPKVTALFEEKEEDVRDKAVEALGKIGKPAVGQLGRLLGNNNAQIRLEAARALEAIGTDAAGAANLLAVHIQAPGEDPRVREACAKALAKIQGR